MPIEFTDESLKGNETLTKFESVDDFGKAFLDTHTKATEAEKKAADLEGKLSKAVFIPGEEAKPEEIAAYQKALGVPEKPEDYKFEKPKDIPAGLDYQDGVVQWWAQLAHKAGLPDKAAKAIFEEYNKFAIANYNQQVKELAEKVEKENQSAQAALKAKWGQDYDKNFELAKRCVQHFGGEEFGKKVIEYGLGNDPGFLEFMVKVASAFKDDTLADLTMASPKEERKPGQLVWSFPSMPG